MNKTNDTCPHHKVIFTGPISRYYTEDGTAIETEKLLNQLCGLGADTTEIEAFLNSLDKEEQL